MTFDPRYAGPQPNIHGKEVTNIVMPSPDELSRERGRPIKVGSIILRPSSNPLETKATQMEVVRTTDSGTSIYYGDEALIQLYCEMSVMFPDAEVKLNPKMK